MKYVIKGECRCKRSYKKNKKGHCIGNYTKPRSSILETRRLNSLCHVSLCHMSRFCIRWLRETFPNFNGFLVKINLTSGQQSCFRLLNPDWAIQISFVQDVCKAIISVKSNIPFNSIKETFLW